MTPWRPPSMCAHMGCANTAADNSSSCDEHLAEKRAATDRARGRRGYDTRGHRKRFRLSVLHRDPLCVLCGHIATIADHYPKSRRDLINTGSDPDDPQHGRGLCKPCHDTETATHQPGGWHATNQLHRND